MLNILVRVGKRLAVLVPALVVGYLSVTDIFPRFRHHLPLVWAIIATYILGAYALVPAIIRGWRIIFPPKHLPLYCVTPDGFASDPINIALIGTRHQIMAAMAASGWHLADKHTPRNLLRAALSTIYGWDYEAAPMSSLFLFGRKQDLGFEIPIEGGQAGSRHHVRFWAATYQDGERFNVRSIHWHNRTAHLRRERLMWIGAASRDVGVTLIRHNAQVTHMIDPDTNAERSLILQNLRAAGYGGRRRYIKLGAPQRIRNRVWFGYLQTDGRMAILDLSESR